MLPCWHVNEPAVGKAQRLSILLASEAAVRILLPALIITHNQTSAWIHGPATCERRPCVRCAPAAETRIVNRHTTSRLCLNERVRASGRLPGVHPAHGCHGDHGAAKDASALCGGRVRCRKAHLSVHEYLALAVFTNEPYQDDADLVENH
jgi:hypothetical protein